MIGLQYGRFAGTTYCRVTLTVIYRDDKTSAGKPYADSTCFAPHGGVQNHITLNSGLDECRVFVDLALRCSRCRLTAGIGLSRQLLLHHVFHLFLQLGLLGRLALALCRDLGLLVGLRLGFLLCVSFCLLGGLFLGLLGFLVGFGLGLFLGLRLRFLVRFGLGFLLSLLLGLLLGFSLLGCVRLGLLLFGLFLLLFLFLLQRQRLALFFRGLALGFRLLGLLLF